MKADPMQLGHEDLPVFRPDRAVAPEGIDVAAARRQQGCRNGHRLRMNRPLPICENFVVVSERFLG